MVARKWRGWLLVCLGLLAGSICLGTRLAPTVQAQGPYDYATLPAWPELTNEYCGSDVTTLAYGSLGTYGTNHNYYELLTLLNCMENLGLGQTPAEIPIPDSPDFQTVLESLAEAMSGEEGFQLPDGSLNLDPLTRGWALPGQTPATDTPGFYITQAGLRFELGSTTSNGAVSLRATYSSNTGQVIATVTSTIGEDGSETIESIETIDRIEEDTEDRLEEEGLEVDVNPITIGDRQDEAGVGGDDEEDRTGLADSASEGCDGHVTGGLNWAFCGILWGVSNGIEVIERQIYRELRVDRSDYQPENCPDPASGVKRDRACNYHDAWRNMRNLMTLAVVGTAILMVIATALDFGWFSNYTVKKYLARLIAGVVLMIMSWAIGDLIISFANSLGGFAGSAITAPFGGASGDGAAAIGLESIFSQFEAGSYAAGGVGVGVAAGIVALSSGLSVVPVLLTAGLGLLGILVGFMFLIFRQVVIIALLVFAPVGVALWFLPGSDKMWRLYYKTFLSLVFIYPIIVGVIAFGRVFIWVLIQTDEGLKEPLVVTTAFLIYVGMFMAIPVLFKKFLGAINQITGGQNNPAKGLFDRLKNARKGYMDQNKQLRKAGRDIKDDEHLAEMRDKQRKGEELTAAEKAKTKAIDLKRRVRRGLPVTSSRWTGRQSTRNMAEVIMAAEEGKRYSEVVGQWSEGGLDTKFNLDSNDFVAYNQSLEAIAQGEDPTGQGRNVSLAETEGALRKLSKHKDEGAFIRLDSKRGQNAKLNQAWNNLVRDGTMFKDFEKVAIDIAKNQIEPSSFDPSGLSDELLQTQSKQTIGRMEISYNRLLQDANSGSQSSGSSYKKLDDLAKQVERLLENKFARNRMPPGTHEALEKIKTRHDQVIEAVVDQQTSTITAAQGHPGWSNATLDTTFNRTLVDVNGNPRADKGETLEAEATRQATLGVAATSGHEALIRQVYQDSSTNSVVQNSLKAALKAELLQKPAVAGGRSVADLAPHLANLEIDDDGNIGRLEDTNWLKLGLTQQQLGNLSDQSAADMEQWFSDNLGKARSDTVFRRDMKSYSSSYLKPAIGNVRQSNQGLATILDRIRSEVDNL